MKNSEPKHHYYPQFEAQIQVCSWWYNLRVKHYLIHPPFIFFLSLLGEYLFHLYFPIAVVIPENLRQLGVAMIIVSLLLALWQFFTMQGKTKIPYGSRPSALLKSGPFKFTRNAFYLSIILISFGFATYLRDLSPFIIVFIEFIIFDKYFIPTEEKDLDKAFGEEYSRYKKSVRRWI